MATESSSNSGGISVLSFLVGALLIAVVAMGIWIAIGGHLWGQAPSPSLNIKIEKPTIPPPKP